MTQTLKQSFFQTKTFFARYPWVIAIIVILLVYWRLPLTYFEQDEWMAFNQYIFDGDKSIVNCVSVQRPLTCLINSVQWRLFGTNATAYAFLSLLLISLTAIVFYRVLRHWNLPKPKAVLAAALFPLFAVGSQAITWFGAFSASLPSFLFGLLALDFLFQDIKKPSLKLAAASFVCAVFALYFKEEALWLLPTALVGWYTYSIYQAKPRSMKHLLRHVGVLIGFVVIFLLAERLRQSQHAARFTGLISSTNTKEYIADVVRSFIFLPYHHLSHIILPPEQLAPLADFFVVKIMTLSGLLTSLMLIYFAGLLVWGGAKDRPTVLFLVTWALATFSSYAIFGKNPEFLEGRYYYTAQAPVAALLALGLIPRQLPNFKALNTFGVAVLLAVLLANLAIADKRMTRSVATSKERKHILNFIQKSTGPLPEKAIIYTETTNYGYAGQAAAILPFQNGLATTLRVLYQGKNQDYRAVSTKQEYLWNLLEQGYDEVSNTGFGYYREYDKLSTVVRDRQIPINSIFAFRYQNKDISDITSLIRGRLLVEQKALEPIPREGWKISTSNDDGVDTFHRLDKLYDDNPKSDWSTTHTHGQYLEVDLGKPVDDIASVVLRTADGNSFPRIFDFAFSSDGVNWKTDFTEVGKLVNDADTPIIFGPKPIQKFRITVVDSRPTIFNWSVSHITVFKVKQD